MKTGRDNAVIWLYFFLGALLNFFGSMALYLSWLVAPLIGVGAAIGIRRGVRQCRAYPREGTLPPSLSIMLAMGAGAFVGGFPMWMMITSGSNSPSLLVKLQIFVTPALFFLGGICIYSYVYISTKIHQFRARTGMS